ncbi:MAG: hypothetical protein ACHQ7N_21700, partial [Candidatus Methylomirabilales bacterium]
ALALAYARDRAFLAHGGRPTPNLQAWTLGAIADDPTQDTTKRMFQRTNSVSLSAAMECRSVWEATARLDINAFFSEATPPPFSTNPFIRVRQQYSLIVHAACRAVRAFPSLSSQATQTLAKISALPNFPPELVVRFFQMLDSSLALSRMLDTPVGHSLAARAARLLQDPPSPRIPTTHALPHNLDAIPFPAPLVPPASRSTSCPTTWLERSPSVAP